MTTVLHSSCLLEVCKSPTEVPKFEWINKYQKTSKSQGVVKQALAPLGTTLNKLQQRKTGLWSFFSPLSWSCDRAKITKSSLTEKRLHLVALRYSDRKLHHTVVRALPTNVFQRQILYFWCRKSTQKLGRPVWLHVLWIDERRNCSPLLVYSRKAAAVYTILQCTWQT